MTANSYKHTHSAHCESGVMSSLLNHHGVHLSEAMVFGVSSALSFAYLPFVKLGGMPLIAYRSLPKSIIKNIRKNLGVEMKLETFSNKEKGEARLDEMLAQGQIVGAQTSVFWLPYFPEEMRFHFNAHNLIVFGKEGDNYKISDPVFETETLCDTASLTKSRFTKGVMAPKGLLYSITKIPDSINLKTVLPKSIKKTAKSMLKTPVPIAGLKGIKFLAKSIVKLQKKDVRYARLYLGHIVRMQEEIGTGGAGFRYLYAAFLQEASDALDKNAALLEASEMMLLVGDKWREFALLIVKSIKSKEAIDFQALSNALLAIAEDEALVYQKMLTFDQ